VFSGRKRERSPRENPPLNGDFGGFSLGELSPCEAKYDKQQPKCRVLLCGGAKGRHAKSRKDHHLAGFRVAPFLVFAHHTIPF